MRYTIIGTGITRPDRGTASGLRNVWETCRTFVREHRTIVRSAAVSTCAGVGILLGVQAMNLAPLRTTSYERALVGPTPSTQQSITIANSGLTYIKGARIQSISNSRIIAISAWDTRTFSWVVHIGGETRIVLSGGELGALSDLRVGEFVNITGDLAGESSNMYIEAHSLRLVSPKDISAPIVNLQDIEG